MPTSTAPLVSEEFSLDFALSFFEDILYNRSNYFYFLGKIEGTVVEGQDNILSSDDNERNVRDNIIFLKKLFANNVSLVAKRVEWESGKIFSQWDHTDTTIFNKDFYCLNSKRNVFKCLDNNQGSPSTVEPDGISVNPKRTSDGYLWKYLYTISETQANKFMTDDFIPVQRAISESFYNRGAIEEILVLEGGSGFDYSDTASIVLTNEESVITGSGAEVEITSVDDQGGITALNVVSAGVDYFSGARVSILSSSGVNAIIIPNTIDASGSIQDYEIVEPGQGYVTTDTLEVQVGGASLLPVISKDNGSVIDVIIEDSGVGYASAPDLSIINPPTTSEATGLYDGNSTAVIRAIVSGGEIVRVVIDDPGVDYPHTSNTQLIVNGDGSGCNAHPIIDKNTGEILSVVVTDPGTGYTWATISVIGDGSGALFQPQIRASDFESHQSTVEQTVVEGAIYSVFVTNGGSSYSRGGTKITIEGDGSGATASAIIENGEIKSIKMDTYGSGYTWASVLINDVYGTGASGYAILSPFSNGHGFDAPNELNAKTVCLYTVMKKDDILEDLIESKYHQYGLLKNPIFLNNNLKANAAEKMLDIVVKIDNSVTFDSLSLGDIVIEQSTNTRHRIIHKITDGSLILHLQQLSFIYRNIGKSFFKENDDLISFNVDEIVSLPSINKYSGKLFYVTNRKGFTVNNEQFLTIRSFITFSNEQE